MRSECNLLRLLSLFLLRDTNGKKMIFDRIGIHFVFYKLKTSFCLVHRQVVKTTKVAKHYFLKCLFAVLMILLFYYSFIYSYIKSYLRNNNISGDIYDTLT